MARRDPVIEWAFAHRCMLSFDEVREAWYMPPESVILTKLRTFRDSGSTRHLEDVEGILPVSCAGVDRAYIAQEAAKMEMLPTWRELQDRTMVAWEDGCLSVG